MENVDRMSLSELHVMCDFIGFPRSLTNGLPKSQMQFCVKKCDQDAVCLYTDQLFILKETYSRMVTNSLQELPRPKEKEISDRKWITFSNSVLGKVPSEETDVFNTVRKLLSHFCAADTGNYNFENTWQNYCAVFVPEMLRLHLQSKCTRQSWSEVLDDLMNRKLMFMAFWEQNLFDFFRTSRLSKALHIDDYSLREQTIAHWFEHTQRPAHLPMPCDISSEVPSSSSSPCTIEWRQTGRDAKLCDTKRTMRSFDLPVDVMEHVFLMLSNITCIQIRQTSTTFKAVGDAVVARRIPHMQESTVNSLVALSEGAFQPQSRSEPLSLS